METFVGFVLAAGFGQRLQPITQYAPKPLMPFFGATLLERAIEGLSQLGLERIIVNLHHKAALIRATTLPPPNLRLDFSHEQPHICGTAGALTFARKAIGSNSVILLNADVLSTFPLAELKARHQATGADATLALLPTPHRGETILWDEQGWLAGLGGPPPRPNCAPRGYACAAILSPAFLTRLPRQIPLDLGSCLQKGLQDGLRIATSTHPCFWHDLGSPARLEQAYGQLIEQANHHAQNSTDNTWSPIQPRQIPVRFVPKGTELTLQQHTIAGPSLIVGAYNAGELTGLPQHLMGPSVITPAPMHCPSMSIQQHTITPVEGTAKQQSPGPNIYLIAQQKGLSEQASAKPGASYASTLL